MELNITKDNGEIVSAKYLRARVVAALSKYRRIYTLAERNAAIADTLDNPEWMQRKAGYTVGAIIREVERKI
jgi:hypothetical protein